MFGASSELAPNMFGASSKLASVMEFGFNRGIPEFISGFHSSVTYIPKNGILGTPLSAAVGLRRPNIIAQSCQLTVDVRAQRVCCFREPKTTYKMLPVTSRRRDASRHCRHDERVRLPRSYVPTLLTPGAEDDVEDATERQHAARHPEHALPRRDRYLTHNIGRVQLARVVGR